MTRDAAGNLYGTTFYGGVGAGVAYRLDGAGRYTVLHSFTGGAGGANPSASVVLDPSGNIYGTASNGGETSGGFPGEGLVFELGADGTYTVLYAFTGGADGGIPNGVVRDKAGNLFGTTSFGGDKNCAVAGCGVAFEVDASGGGETVLHTFTGGATGAGGGALILDSAGALCGNSGGGVTGGGLLFKITLQTAAAAPGTR